MSYKVLIISYIALISTTPNGRTMQSLLQGVEKENLSLFCVRGTPDNHCCASTYRVTNKDALMSLLKLKEMGGVLPLDSSSQKAGTLDKSPRHGDKKSLDYLLREIAWKYGKWNGKKLKNWLNEQKPDCIIYMYGDGAALQNLSVFVSRFLNIPLIVYSCENYCFKGINYIDYKKFSIPFYFYNRMSSKATKELFRQASALISNSDQLGEEYKRAYNIQNIKTVMMASNMEFIENFKVKDTKDIRVVYLGSLKSRADSLAVIANTLSKINPELKLDVYGNITDEYTKNVLENCPFINYKGFVSYDKVKEIMYSSTLLIETIDTDPITVEKKKYGFSTKFADSFACGTPFLVYASKEIIEMRFALEHKCAFAATCEKELLQTLTSALFDEGKRKEQIYAAKSITAKYFNNEKNIATVNNLIANCVENKVK
ncbi:MAG: glycosyltransferase [Clostridiales bacterium]|nr:glycosyltransferase [Clostridiales bacterium]